MKVIVLEKVLSTDDRNSLKDSQFGIPELRKYPMPDASHVKSAIAYFNKCPSKYKKELAKNIFKKAKQFGLNLSKDTEIGDYL